MKISLHRESHEAFTTRHRSSLQQKLERKFAKLAKLLDGKASAKPT